MQYIIILLSLIAVPPAPDALPANSVQQAVQRAIDTYEPFPESDRHDLGGVGIGVDWAVADGCSDAACSARLSQTAGYLFHYLRDRGAKIVLSHAPGVTNANDPATSPSRRAAVLAEADSKLTILLRCPHGPSGVQGGNAFAAALGKLLPPAWGTSGALDDVFANKDAADVCVVTFPAMADDADPWRQTRADALALSDALGKYAVALGLARNATVVPELPGDSRVRQWARLACPDGQLPFGDADRFCRLFLRLAISNPACTYANISATVVGDGVELTGATNVPFLARAVHDALSQVGITNITNKIRSLPDAERLGDVRFGACRVPAVLTRSQPSELAGLQTELLYGEPVYLLDRDGAFLLVQGGDGYWGWVASDAVATLSEKDFIAYLNRPEVALLRDVTASGMVVPRGARVRVSAEDGDTLSIGVTANDRLTVPRGAVEYPRTHQPEFIEQRVRAALDLLHTPYVFGGRSPAGLDCSGLCMNVAARSGESIPRDAAQQVLVGTLAATAWFRGDLRPGDQVFFIDQSGKVYHTGIAISPTHILHSAPPGVRIGSFVKGDRLYDTRMDRDFFIAKRP
ncbi:MAG: C40 family peptidase [Phycisphaerales bacterium]|nr:C40 family peptidase [Phycisphaerales bacterium]